MVRASDCARIWPPVCPVAPGQSDIGDHGRLVSPEHGRPWLDAFRRADRVVTVSRFFEDGLRDRGLSRICTIQNHVDLSRFRPEAKDPTLLERLGIRHGQIVVAHVSKIEPIKRPLDLVAVASKIGQAADLVYLIVGEGPLLAEMKETCRKLMVMDRFRFVGWVPYDRIPGFLNIADMVVQPSEREGLSRVYLEAMACGRTLIASDIPAAREVVRHRENGLLFDEARAFAKPRRTSQPAKSNCLPSHRRDECARPSRLPYAVGAWRRGPSPRLSAAGCMYHLRCSGKSTPRKSSYLRSNVKGYTLQSRPHVDVAGQLHFLMRVTSSILLAGKQPH